LTSNGRYKKCLILLQKEITTSSFLEQHFQQKIEKQIYMKDVAPHPHTPTSTYTHSHIYSRVFDTTNISNANNMEYTYPANISTHQK